MKGFVGTLSLDGNFSTIENLHRELNHSHGFLRVQLATVPRAFVLLSIRIFGYRTKSGVSLYDGEVA